MPQMNDRLEPDQHFIHRQDPALRAIVQFVDLEKAMVRLCCLVAPAEPGKLLSFSQRDPERWTKDEVTMDIKVFLANFTLIPQL